MRIGAWLFAHERIKRAIGEGELAAAVDARFIDRTYETLGWKIPARPPFLPKDWAGSVGEPPYPPYLSSETLGAPQAWPEPGDLTRPWTFNGKTYRP